MTRQGEARTVKRAEAGREARGGHLDLIGKFVDSAWRVFYLHNDDLE